MRAKVLAALLLAAFASSVAAVDPFVDTPIGQLTGILALHNGSYVEQFLGIPYAKPPTGNLRFAYPQEFGNVGNFKAQKHSAICHQATKNGQSWLSPPESEDCLHLNVYRNPGTKEGDKKSVVVIIHGGAFANGHSSELVYDPIPFVIRHDVIVVSFNYRLGTLGFADMGDLAPGNVGLFDQRMALIWVKQHIQAFGGNPNKITIWGVSAGATSVASHIVTPLNKGLNLFQAAIMDAGVILPATMSENDASLKKVKRLAAEKFNCPTEGQDMLECLRKQDAGKLTTLAFDAEESPVFTFGPTVDGKFITKDLTKHTAAEYSHVRILMGFASEEGSMFAPYYLGKTTVPVNTKEDFVKWCSKFRSDNNFANFDDPQFQELLVDLYFEKSESHFHDVSDFLTDFAFSCKINAFVRNYSQVNEDVYIYHFKRKLSQKYFTLDPALLGAFHGSPFIHMLGPLLRLPTVGIKVPQVDQQFFLDSMDMIKGFLDGRPVFRGHGLPNFAKGEGIIVIDDTPELSKTQAYADRCKKLLPVLEN